MSRFRTFFISVLLLQSFLSTAQQQVKLLELKKPVDGFKRNGGVNLYGGAMYGNASSISTSRIDMTEADDGVVVRVDFDLYKFSNDQRQLWHAVLPKVYGIMDMPFMHIVSDPLSTYTVEFKTLPLSSDKMSVVQIGQDGKVYAQKYEAGIQQNDRFELFALNGDLVCLGKKINDKTDKIEYRLYKINKTDHKLTVKLLNLPTTDDEYKLGKKGSDIYWNAIGKDENNLILVKSYFKDTQEKKIKTMVMQVCELSADGSISSARDLFFEPTLAGLDRQFVSPSIKYNPADNSLTVAGFMEIENKKINGLYLLKYDYQTGSIIHRHEHNFNDILKPNIKPNLKVHYKIPENVHQVYPLTLRNADVFIDQLTGFTDVRIVTDYDLNSVTFFEVKFDHYGDHIQTGVTEFRQLISGFREIVPKPTKYQLVWRDEVRPHFTAAKPGLWDLIDSKADDDKHVDLYWLPISRPSGNLLLCYDQTLGTFTVIEQKK